MRGDSLASPEGERARLLGCEWASLLQPIGAAKEAARAFRLWLAESAPSLQTLILVECADQVRL